MVKISKKMKEIGSIGIADILVTGISAIFWFYIAATIGPEGYGQIAYLLSIANLGSTVSLFGANRALMIYPAKGIEIQTAMYVITLSLGMVSMLIVYFFVNDIGTSFLVFSLLIFGLIGAELIGRKLYVTYAKYLIVQRILMVILAITSYNIFGQEGIILAIALSYSPFLIEIIRGFRNYKIDFALFKEKFTFIRNSYFESLSGTVSSSLDKLIIVPIFGFAILGNYALGLQFFTLLTIIPLAAMKYLIAEESSGTQNKKLKKYLIIFSIIAAILGFTVGPEIISSIFPKFSGAEDIIRIITWAIIPSTVTSSIFLPKFLSMERGRVILIGSIIWTVTQLLGILSLGYYFDTNGIAIAYLLASISSTIFYAIIYRRDYSK